MAVSIDIEKDFKGFSLRVKFESTCATMGILGASGSGKSMTLRCIAGIETPDRGKIIVNGRRSKRILPVDIGEKIRRNGMKRSGIILQDIIWKDWRIICPPSFPAGSSKEWHLPG